MQQISTPRGIKGQYRSSIIFLGENLALLCCCGAPNTVGHLPYRIDIACNKVMILGAGYLHCGTTGSKGNKAILFGTINSLATAFPISSYFKGEMVRAIGSASFVAVLIHSNANLTTQRIPQLHSYITE